MRGSLVEFYVLRNRNELPSNLEVGRLYFIHEEGVILLNHGGALGLKVYGDAQLSLENTANDDRLGLIQTSSQFDGGVEATPEGILTTVKASQLQRGTIRSAEDSITEYTGPWGIGVDINGKAYVSGRREGEALALSAASEPGATNAFSTANDLARERAAANLALMEETEARRVAESNINARIDAVSGKLRYMEAKNFGVANPSFEQLSDWAMEQTGLDHVEMSTTIINLFDNMEWVFDADLQQWKNIGTGAVQTATNTSLGVVRGDTAEGGVQVRVDGRLLSPPASPSAYGGVRVRQTVADTAPVAQQIKTDINNVAYFDGVTLDAIAGANASSATAANPMATRDEVTAAELRWNA